MVEQGGPSLGRVRLLEPSSTEHWAAKPDMGLLHWVLCLASDCKAQHAALQNSWWSLGYFHYGAQDFTWDKGNKVPLPNGDFWQFSWPLLDTKMTI